MLQSERIQLRKITGEDAELYHTWRNDLDVMKTTSLHLDVYTYEETKTFVENVMLGSADSKSYMIVDQGLDKTIGVTALIHIDLKNRNAECLIDIGEKDYWGKGYAKESLQLLLDYAFLELNLHRVDLQVFAFNHGAIKLYEKLGFTHEGKQREAIYRNGEYHDILHMGMLKREYVPSTKP